MTDALQGFEPIENPIRSEWCSLIDQFQVMDCDRIGKTVENKKEAERVRTAINSAIKRRGYRMSAHKLGCLVYVEKEKSNGA